MTALLAFYGLLASVLSTMFVYDSFVKELAEKDSTQWERFGRPGAFFQKIKGASRRHAISSKRRLLILITYKKDLADCGAKKLLAIRLLMLAVIFFLFCFPWTLRK